MPGSDPTLRKARFFQAEKASVQDEKAIEAVTSYVFSSEKDSVDLAIEILATKCSRRS